MARLWPWVGLVMSVPEDFSVTGGAYFMPVTDGQMYSHLRASHAQSDRLSIQVTELKAALYHKTIEAEALYDALKQIEEIAHNNSTGPTVPDVLWEIRGIAQAAL